MRVPISLLNRTPAFVAARFRRDQMIGRVMRRIVGRVMSSEETVAVVRAGTGRSIRLVIDPTREKYYWTGQHDVPVQLALAKILRPGSTFWDIGAHVGFFAILAARIVGPQGRVHAFEPMPDNRRRLREAVELNQTPQVRVHEFAISASDGSVVLHGHSASAMWTLIPERGEFEALAVESRTIDRLAAELGPPDAAKIDVEGAELDVLRGAVGTIAASKPTLVVEFASPEGVEAARSLLPGYRFEQLSQLDWLLTARADQVS